MAINPEQRGERAVTADTPKAGAEQRPETLAGLVLDAAALQELDLGIKHDQQLDSESSSNYIELDVDADFTEAHEPDALAAEPASAEPLKAESDKSERTTSEPSTTEGKSKDLGRDKSADDNETGKVGAGARRLAKPPVEQKQPAAAAPQREVMQDLMSRPFSIRTRVSEMAREEPDSHSRWRQIPQPDEKGLQAAAAVYVDRQLSKTTPDVGAKPDSETAATKPVPETAAEAGNTEKSVVWSFTHNGLEPQRFLKALDERDPTGTVAGNTRLVLAFDSEAKRDAVQQAGLFAADTGYEVIDPAHPETIKLPDNTAVALLPELLSEQPAHALVKLPDGKIVEMQNRTERSASEPFLTINDRGQAATVDPAMFGKYRTGNSPEIVRQFASQLTGSHLIETSSHPTSGKPQVTPVGAIPYLAEKDVDIHRFISEMPTNRIVNFAENVPGIVQAVTSGVRSDGIVVITDPTMRNPIDPAGKVHSSMLQQVHGPFANNVVETTSILSGALGADPRATYDVFNPTPGERGRMMVDRCRDPDEVEVAKGIFRETLEAAPTPEQQLLDNLDTQLSEYLAAANKPDTAQKAVELEQAYQHLESIAPELDQTYATLLRRAQLANLTKQPGTALNLAERAVQLDPHFSAGYLEAARARLASGGDLSAVSQDLVRAQSLSPTNPDVYKLTIDAMASKPEFARRHLSHYADAVVNYLRYEPNIDARRAVKLLESVCNSQEALLWQQHRGDNSRVKTFLREDLETGKLTKDGLSAEQWGQIQAADLWRANGEVAGELLSHRYMLGEQRRFVDPFLAGYERVAPRGAEGNILPRDQWDDRAQGRQERLRVAGDMSQTDAEVPPDELLAWGAKRQQELLALERYAQKDGAPEALNSERPKVPRRSIYFGPYLDTTMESLGSGGELPVDLLTRHGIMLSKTGGGKTTGLVKLLSQMPEVENAAGEEIHFMAVELGEKVEMPQIAETLKAHGIDVAVQCVGAADEIPVSLDVLKPEGDVEEHIGRMTDMWIMAYGGGGSSPVRSIVSKAMRYVYAANGHVTSFKRDDLRPGEVMPVVRQPEDRTTPSWEEVIEACKRRAVVYERGTEAANLTHYFDQRKAELTTGPLAEFLSGKNRVVGDELANQNTIWSFAKLTEQDQRRMAYVALMQKIAVTSLNKNEDPRLLVAADEPDIIIKQAGPSEAQEARREAVERYTGMIRRMRGNGVAMLHLTQSLVGIEDLVVSQAGYRFTGPLDDEKDKRTILTAMGYDEDDDEFKRLHKQLSSQETGVAVIKIGSNDAQTVKIEALPKPTALQTFRARENRTGVKVHPGPYNGYTNRERGLAAAIAEDPGREAQRAFVGAVALGHIAAGAIGLPKKAPVGLQERWQKDSRVDPRHEKLVLQVIADNEVTARAPAVQTAYNPDLLSRSIVSHATSTLRGEPGAGEYASTAFAIPQVLAAAAIRRLQGFDFDRAPKETTIAWPQPFAALAEANQFRRERLRKGSDNPAAPVTPPQTSLEQLEGLRRLGVSPTQGQQRQARIAAIALLGLDTGSKMLADVFAATGRNPNRVIGRRLMAEQLGYVNNTADPRRSAYEEMLWLAAKVPTIAKQGDSL